MTAAHLPVHFSIIPEVPIGVILVFIAFSLFRKSSGLYCQSAASSAQYQEKVDAKAVIKRAVGFFVFLFGNELGAREEDFAVAMSDDWPYGFQENICVCRGESIFFGSLYLHCHTREFRGDTVEISR